MVRMFYKISIYTSGEVLMKKGKELWGHINARDICEGDDGCGTYVQ
ncbi:9033_t:CDS:2, partial [Funneliformis geosporum]